MIKATKTKSGKYTTLVPYYTADGKRHFKRFTDDTERKTINKAMSFTAEMNFLATNITVAQALEKYISSRRNLSPSTIRGYRSIQRNNFVELQKKEVSRLSSALIQTYVDQENDKGLSPKSIINAYNLIASALKETCNISFNNIKLPKIQKHKKILINKTLIEQIIVATQGRACELPVLFAITCGLRISEICGLKWSDYDGENIIIQRAMVRGPDGYVVKETNKTYAGNRVVILPNCVREKLDNQKRKSDFIITQKPSKVYESYKAALKAHSLPDMNFHFLRHINTSIMIALNIQPQYAMQRNGWDSDYMYKNTYAEIITEEMKKSHEIINETFDEIAKKCVAFCVTKS